MTKSQIIEILQQYVDFTEYERGQVNNRLYNAIADAILALPIEMPTEEEIEAWAEDYAGREDSNRQKFIDAEAFGGYVAGANLMKDEIIRRNK